MITLLTLWSVILCSFAVGMPLQQGQQKPVRQIDVFWVVDPRGIEIPALYKTATAVVKAKIEQSRSFVQEVGRPVTHVTTEHQVRVLEVLKGDPGVVVGARLVVWEPAGRVDVGDYIAEVANFRVWQPGEEYVLFLGGNPAKGRANVSAPWHAYRIAAGKISAEPWSKLDGTDAVAFLTELRGLRDAGRKREPT
jgi:hypothetical protein